jgi:four helix bundle protein
MTYQEWVEKVPSQLTGDALWKVEAYRLGLFVADVGWQDVTKLVGDRRTLGLSDQVYRALGSISANLAEGYSRGTGKVRARFYEYALGSARESRDWYYKARHVLGEEVCRHRLDLLTQIVRLLLVMVPQQRDRVLREPEAGYQIHPTADQEALDRLLHAVPFASDDGYDNGPTASHGDRT